MNIVRKASLIASALLLTIAFGAARAMADSVNGGTGVSGDPAITEADGWVEFTFGATGSTTGPFTFSGPELIQVTDGFEAGDQFALLDGATLLGDTSSVATGPGDGCTHPASCFLDPLYSHGSFFVGAGGHSITIEAIASPFGGGGAWLEVVPEPSSFFLLGSGLLGFIGVARRKLLV